MTDTDFQRRIDEIDRLINDPTVPMQPARVWSLLDELKPLMLGPVAERREAH